MANNRVEELMPLVFRVLTEKAIQKEVITYGSLAEIVGTHPRVIPSVLKRILTLCINKNWPPITAIVVNKRTGKTSCAFYDQWLLGYTSESVRLGKWKEILDDVYSYDWTNI